jgi:hypothetical protein
VWAIDVPRNGTDKLNKIARTVLQQACHYNGFNFSDENDEAPFLALGLVKR